MSQIFDIIMAQLVCIMIMITPYIACGKGRCTELTLSFCRCKQHLRNETWVRSSFCCTNCFRDMPWVVLKLLVRLYVYFLSNYRRHWLDILNHQISKADTYAEVKISQIFANNLIINFNCCCLIVTRVISSSSQNNGIDWLNVIQKE